MSVEEAAVALGLGRDWLYNRINGRTSIAPDDDELFWQKAKDAFDLPPTLARQLGVENVLANGGLLADPYEAPPRSTVRMRYAGAVPCSSLWGDPLESTDYVEVPAQFSGQSRFAAKVVADSCYPALQPGDLTVWEPDRNPPYGVIVLAERKGDHGATVKKLVYDPVAGRPRLEPVNATHSAPDDGEGWSVIARLVGVERAAEAPSRTWYWEPGLRPEHLA